MTLPAFLLDQDVSILVARWLRAEGYQCETASSRGMSDAADDDLVVTADNQCAVFVTHDKELIRKRERHPIGRIVGLRCPEPNAPTVLARHMHDILPILARHQDVVVQAWPTRFAVSHGWKGWADGDPR